MRRSTSNMKVILCLWMLAMAANIVIGMHQSSSGGAQYFITNPDGSYKYAFDTNTGGFQEQQRGADGAVAGKYGFVGAGGSSVNVQYTAKGGIGGDGGAGYHKQQYSTSHYQAPANTYSSGGGGQGDYSMSLNPDGTYTYQYTLSDQAKAESRGADGRVKGQFSFTDPTGQNRAIKYTADEGGFQAFGDHIPVAGAGQASHSGSGHNYGGGASSYSSGASSYGGSYGGSAGGAGDYMLKLGPDGQYQYSYSLSDQAKSEMMGPDGKVKGQFSFTDPTGQHRAITYTADEGGFQPKGAHIPVAETGSSHHTGASSYGGSYGGSSYGGSAHGASTYGASSYGGSSLGGGGSGTLNMKLGPSGQYEYSYSLSDQAKSESRGQDGRVKGQFSYTGKDGQKKAITYTADERGFLAEGDHIPKPSQEFYDAHQKASSHSGGYGGGSYGGGSDYNSYSGSTGQQGGAGGSYSFDYATQGQAHSQSSSGGGVSGQYSVNTDGSHQKVSYSANGNQGYNPVVEFTGSVGGGIAGDGAYGKSSYSGPSYGGQSHDSGFGGGAGAGSYSFDYNTADHSHSQSGGGSGVSGQYSAASEGGSQKVTYDANGQGGYKPIVEVKTKVGGGKTSHTSSAGYGSGSSYSGSKYSSHGSSGLVGSTDHSGSGGAWSYEYNAGAHDHQQKGSNGQAHGQYNVQSAGGSQKSSYTAGSGGFMPTHDINIKVGAGGKKSSSHY